jgi:hypothetical protein
VRVLNHAKTGGRGFEAIWKLRSRSKASSTRLGPLCAPRAATLSQTARVPMLVLASPRFLLNRLDPISTPGVLRQLSL